MELFAGELRRLRSGAGLSQEALAEKISYSASLVAAVEQCRRPPQLEFAQQCDQVLGSEGLLLRIREVCIRESLVPWFREWAAIEREARALRTFQPLVIPGLLQTADYARGMYEGGTPLTADELDQIVLGRLTRQEILESSRPPLLVAVIDYSVLERPVGGPKIMREQLLHLAEAATRPFVHVHVIPRGVGGYLGLGGPFVLATAPDGADMAYLDNQLKGMSVDGVEELRYLRDAWECVRADALPQRQSHALIAEAANQWT
ncbi:Scr1 family TA system antitoxin-like transcriptional regulator [Actinoplanes sp. NPDC051859]|uniref:helix-turn-helix domain-containing protein n=1 Tax=Actinoplanes sp. NPDC051859 TaxID=3363909 RepID=UPI00378FBEB7